MKTLVVLAALVLIGAGAVFAVHQIGWSALTGKAWAITYEVTGSGSADIAYASSPDRYRIERPHSTTTSAGVPWQSTVVINAGERAEVTAKPSGDQALTCRILLDDEKVLATATSPAAGQPVTCQQITGK